MERAGETVIHFELGRPDFDTPEYIKKACIADIEKGDVFYTSNFGTMELREAIAWKLKTQNNVDYKPSEIIVSVGLSEAVFDVMTAILDEGDEILVPNPGWLNYLNVPKLLGATPITYTLKEENDYQIDLDEIRAKVTPRTKAMVISDEVYERLLYDDAKHISIASLPGMKERTITLNGFSKAYSMTGWRLGYAACNEEIVKTVNKLHQHVVTCATSFVQKAGVVALKEEKNEVTDMVKEYQRRRDYAVKAINEIDGLSCRCPKGAFYIFINIEKLGMTGQEFAPLLLENAKVALVPGDVFGTEGDHYVRMSFANSYENVVEGCKRLKEFVEKLRRNK